MKLNIQNRVIRGVILSLVLLAFTMAVFAPCVYAASTTVMYAKVNVSTLNVRTGPGTSYSKAYVATTGDILYLTGQIGTGDGYTWYELSGGDGYWIADTGGWTFVTSTLYEDTISAYDAYGASVWDHTCYGETADWYYHFEVHNEGYYVRCDCGWWEYRSIPTQYDGEGNIYLCFIGLDTDNDERVDLKPGQTKSLKCRGNSSLRPYTILEFVDRPNVDTPTVNLVFHDADYNVIAEYSFLWKVNVHVEAYGVVMEGMDGTKKIHYVDGDFLLYDRSDELFLGDNVRTYETMKQHNGKGYITLAARHMTFYFCLEPPGEGDLGLIEWVTHVVRNVQDYVTEILTFFGLGFLFIREDSPFCFLIGG